MSSSLTTLIVLVSGIHVAAFAVMIVIRVRRNEVEGTTGNSALITACAMCGEPATQGPPQVMNPSVRYARSLPNALPNLGGFRQMSSGSGARKNVLRAPRQGFQNLHSGVRERQQVRAAGFRRRYPPSLLLQVDIAPACR